MTDLYLQHYGIKGMKWGVRRTPEQLGHRKGTSSVTKRVVNDYNRMDDKQFKAKYHTSKSTYAKRYKKYNDPYKDAPLAKIGRKLGERQKQKAKSDAVKEMSDEELRKRLNRIQMEKQYKQLTKRDAVVGEKFVKELTRELGKEYAKKYINKGIQAGIKYLMEA